MKSREQVTEQVYLNQSDIRILLGIGYQKAKHIYQLAEEIDEKELTFRVEPAKVRITSLCKVIGVTLATLSNKKRSCGNRIH